MDDDYDSYGNKLTLAQQQEQRRAKSYFKDFKVKMFGAGIVGLMPIKFDSSASSIAAAVRLNRPYNPTLEYGLKDIENHKPLKSMTEELVSFGFSEQQAQRMSYFFTFSHEHFHALSHLTALANKKMDRQAIFNEDLAALTSRLLPKEKTEWASSNFNSIRKDILTNLGYEEEPLVPTELLALSIQIEESNSDKCALVQISKLEKLDRDQSIAFARAVESWRLKHKNTGFGAEELNNLKPDQKLLIEMVDKAHQTGDLASFVADKNNMTLSPASLLNKARLHTMDNVVADELGLVIGLSASIFEDLKKRDLSSASELNCSEDYLSRTNGINVSLHDAKAANSFLRTAANVATETKSGFFEILDDSAKLSHSSSASLTTAVLAAKVSAAALHSFRKIKQNYEQGANDQNLGVVGDTKIFMGCKIKNK